MRPTFALVLAGLLAVSGCGGASLHAVRRRAAPGYERFHTRPDLKPPRIDVTSRRDPARGYVFLAPKKHAVQHGPLIVDDHGQPVWFDPLPLAATDFRVQRYRGRRVLTWWQGRSKFGIGQGDYVIVDSSYRRIAAVHAGNGLAGDEHEFTITPRNTALITAYHPVPADLSSVGGPKAGKVFDSVLQEVDIASGRVLFEWHSVGHVAVSESYWKLRKVHGKYAPHDYFHINSIDLDSNGNFLVSARNTHALYDVSRRDGRILWRLGGKRSDFAMGKGTQMNWQHDARWHADGTISVFDNGAFPKVEDHSRALILRPDLARKRVTLVRAYVHPRKLLSKHQGDLQLLPDGHAFVGWGSEPEFTEFAADGSVVFDASFTRQADSYRAYRLPWVGRPTEPPAIAVEPHEGGATVYASWNGATEVARWQVLGVQRGVLHFLAEAPRQGFETSIRVTRAKAYAVRALDASGKTLGSSRTVASRSGPR